MATKKQGAAKRPSGTTAAAKKKAPAPAKPTDRTAALKGAAAAVERAAAAVERAASAAERAAAAAEMVAAAAGRIASAVASFETGQSGSNTPGRPSAPTVVTSDPRTWPAAEVELDGAGQFKGVKIGGQSVPLAQLVQGDGRLLLVLKSGEQIQSEFGQGFNPLSMYQAISNASVLLVSALAQCPPGENCS